MEMVMPSVLPAPLAGRSMRTTGSRGFSVGEGGAVTSGAGGSTFGGLGGLGGAGAGPVRGAVSSMVSVTLQLKGGSLGRMAATIIRAADSTMNRFQVMLTSQLA
jgi:hypothetical protein